MNAPQRLRAIRTIAAALAKEEWGVIDLTLEEFGCPTSESWSGSKPDYIVQMIRGQSVGTLEALVRYVDLTEGAPTDPPPESDCWKEGYFRLFISHLAKHKLFAHALKTELAKSAISGFVAHDDITPTAEWIAEIERALFSADALVALMHDGFMNSHWTDQEVGVVMGRQRPILAVKLEVDPHGFLGKFQAIRGDENAAVVASRVFRALVGREDTKRDIAYAIVHRTENGIGHNDNQRNFGLLGKLEYFDDILADRLRAAMDDSEYVARAYNKISVMEKVFDRWGYELDYDEP